MGDELEVAEKNKKSVNPAGRSKQVVVDAPPQKAKVEKTPSLKDMLNKIDSIGKQIDAKDNEIASSNSKEDINKAGKSLSQEELTSQFEVFLDKIKKEQPRLHSAMKSQSAIVNTEGNIEIYFQNNAQLEEFRHRLKPSLVSHIRNSLGVTDIEIIEQVVDADKLVKPKLFSDNERFKQLSEKNPALLKLKNLFNLDFE